MIATSQNKLSKLKEGQKGREIFQTGYKYLLSDIIILRHSLKNNYFVRPFEWLSQCKHSLKINSILSLVIIMTQIMTWSDENTDLKLTHFPPKMTLSSLNPVLLSVSSISIQLQGYIVFAHLSWFVTKKENASILFFINPIF